MTKDANGVMTLNAQLKIHASPLIGSARQTEANPELIRGM